MATKTISITEEAYERLVSLKNKNESFSKIIERITNKPNLMDYFGILSKEKGDELEKNIKDLRKRNIGTRSKRIKSIKRKIQWST